MIMLKRTYVLFVAAFFWMHQAQAQTALAAGDIMFIGWNSNDNTVNGAESNDDFLFVLLKGIDPNTKIYFTDMGWVGSNFQLNPSNGCMASQGDLTSGIVEWTATSSMAAGTQVRVRCKFTPNTTSTAGTCSVTGLLPTFNNAAQYMSLGNTGEQFFGFQGTWNSGTKTFSGITLLAGVNYGGAWTSGLNACDLNPTSSRDPGSSMGNYAFLTSGIQVNAYYNGPSTGAAATVRTNILNTSYWVFSGTSLTPNYSLPAVGTTFTVGSTSTVSSINRVSTSPTNSSSVQFTVTFAASTTGLTSSNFTLTSTGVSSPSITGVSGSGTSWTVTVNTGSGNGTIRLDMANTTNLNPVMTNVPYTSGQSYTIYKNSNASDYYRTKGSTGSWNTATDWESSADDSYYVTANAVPTASATSITVQSGHTITLNSVDPSIDELTLTGIVNLNGRTLTLNSVSGSGSFTGSTTSSLSIGGSTGGSAGTLRFTSGSNSLNNLTLNRTGSSAAVTIGNAVNLYGTLTVTAGTLNTGGFITLKSNASGTGRVANVTGAISGNISMEKYIPGGRRVFRFIGHPFTNTIALSSIMGNVDITGTGGATNGFTVTSSNNPSAYYYDPIIGNGSTTSNPGWTAFTSTNGSGGNGWNQYQGIRLLVRGTPGQGLTGSAYTPAATTISYTGTINTGTQSVFILKGSNSGYNLVSNPFPSQIDLNLTTRGGNIGTSFWVWNANQGTRGGYTSSPFSSSYILPSGAAFFVTTAANSGNTLGFPETCKVGTAPTALFRNNSLPNQLELQLETGNIFWDRLLFSLGEGNPAATDRNDAAKLYNPDVNFYSLSPQQEPLSIDARLLLTGSSIPLALYSNEARSFTLTVAENTVMDRELWLHDTYLDQWTKLEKEASYGFATDANALSQGEVRFVIMAKALPAMPQLPASFSLTLSPNPVRDQLNYSYTGLDKKQPSYLSIVDAQGKLLRSLSLGQVESGNGTISMQGMPVGTYMVQLLNGSSKQASTILKQ